MRTISPTTGSKPFTRISQASVMFFDSIFLSLFLFINASPLALGLKEYCPYLKSKTTRLQCPDKTHSHDVDFATEEMVNIHM